MVDTQTGIIRQNCIGNAVKFFEKQELASPDDILRVAEIFEKWVHRV